MAEVIKRKRKSYNAKKITVLPPTNNIADMANIVDIRDKHQVIEMLPKQLQFIYSDKREIMYSGGFRAGKSRSLCYKAVMAANIPGNNVLIVRKTLASLKSTTLKTLLEPDVKLPPVLPFGTYTHNKSEGRIDIVGGGTIMYAGCDNEMRIRSSSFGTICIDEGSELEKEEYFELLYRLSNGASGVQQIVIATNPSSQYHFLYDRFYVEKNPNREVITACSLDNWFLYENVPEYIALLKEMTGVQRERYVNGLWCALDKMVYKDWTNRNIKKRSVDEFKNFYVGVDFGYTAPTAITLIGLDEDNKAHLIEEVKESKLLTNDIIKKVMKYARLKPTVVVDPSAPLIIAELANSGLDAVKANNDVDTGINAMRDRINREYFTIDPSCKEFVKEVMNYGYENDKDKVIKVNDHILDSCRYVLTHISDKMFSKAAYIYPNVNLTDEEKMDDDDDDGDGWTPVEMFNSDVDSFV